MHSCAPNARIAFSSSAAPLSLTAARDLKKGDELTVAFVDVAQREGETPVDCRRRRRMELARGWRFACSCARCEEEAPPAAPVPSASASAGEPPAATAIPADGEEKGKKADKEEDVGLDLKDESKVDASLFRYEEAKRLEKET